jgi:hypothetical protein
VALRRSLKSAPGEKMLAGNHRICRACDENAGVFIFLVGARNVAVSEKTIEISAFPVM